jgi:hypothetical protein
MSSKVLAIALFLLVSSGESSRDAHVTLQVPELALAGIHHAGTYTNFRQNEIPQVKHKKKPGEGYEKGSPLYDKQHKAAPPVGPEGRQRPSLVVIIGVIVLGLIVLAFAAYVNKDVLVKGYDYTPDLPVQGYDYKSADPQYNVDYQPPQQGFPISMAKKPPPPMQTLGQPAAAPPTYMSMPGGPMQPASPMNRGQPYVMSAPPGALPGPMVGGPLPGSMGPPGAVYGSMPVSPRIQGAVYASTPATQPPSPGIMPQGALYGSMPAAQR